jgi:hypothetical protein
MDGAANLMYDQLGSTIYALINMGCEWRRSQVPAGAGNVSGVIVHQEMPRWGGNVGTYSIRPLDESDFNMSAVSQWNTLAEWVMTEGTTDENSYSWKHGVDNVDGYSGTKASILTQNKLCATNGASALIYSETSTEEQRVPASMAREPLRCLLNTAIEVLMLHRRHRLKLSE